MQARQFFSSRHANDRAVSPVIAVILMVAITVVLAATVYVWVSGFGSSGTSPAGTISLTSSGAAANASGNNTKTYVVTSASSGLKYAGLEFTIDGAPFAMQARCAPDTNATVGACGGATVRGASDVVLAGDTLQFRNNATTIAGSTLRVLDANANSIMTSLTIS